MTALTRRAVAAYARRAAADDPIWNNPTCKAQAAACTRAQADILDVPAGRVEAEPDPRRRYGDWPPVSMTVTDRHACYGVTAACADPRRLLSMGPCPLCDGMVPVASLSELADFGRMFHPAARPTDREQLPPEAGGDPGHRAGCLLHEPATA